MEPGNPNSETHEILKRGTETERLGYGHKIDGVPRDPLIEYIRQVTLKYAGEDIDVSAAFRPLLRAIKKLFGQNKTK